MRSRRSLSLGLLKSQPLRGCKSLWRLEDGDKPHPYIGFRSTVYIGFRRAIFEDNFL